MTFLVNDITFLLIPINSRDLIIQLCGTLSKAFCYYYYYYYYCCCCCCCCYCRCCWYLL